MDDSFPACMICQQFAFRLLPPALQDNNPGEEEKAQKSSVKFGFSGNIVSRTVRTSSTYSTATARSELDLQRSGIY